MIIWRRHHARNNFEFQFVAAVRTLLWTLLDELQTHFFSERTDSPSTFIFPNYNSLTSPMRSQQLWVAICCGGAHPFVDSTWLTSNSCFLWENRLAMNIHIFNLEQFDVTDAFATPLSCKLLRMCAHPLLYPTCWTLNTFFGKRNESLWTFKNWN